jgi:hypothetical protein
MDDQDLIREDMQAQWYYGQLGEQLGPVSGQELNHKLRDKEVAPTVLVWRQGMHQWAPITSVPALIQGVKLRPCQIADVVVRRQRQSVSNAKQNSIAMFVIFVLSLTVIMVESVSALSGKEPPNAGCLGNAAALGGIYAAIYLPLRWRTIRQLPSPFGALGLIGGFGLIGIIVVAFAMLLLRGG